MNFNLTSPKAISSLVKTLKNVGSLKARMTETVVVGEGPEARVYLACDHSPVRVELAPGFQELTSAQQSESIMSAISDAKTKVDQEVVKIAGPLAEMFISRTKSAG